MVIWNKDTLVFTSNQSSKSVEGLMQLGKNPLCWYSNKTFTFANKEYYYNDGYCFSKRVWDSEFVCRIEYRNNKPVFIVKNVSSGDEMCGLSATRPWTLFCKVYNERNGTNRLINGPKYFGLREVDILKQLKVH